MADEDPIMDYEQFEEDRTRFLKLLADLEANRPVLEARGDNVDEMISEVKAAWSQYEQAQQQADTALENYLQSIANQVDAGEELLNHVRTGQAWWMRALERASDIGGTDRVQIWEGYQAWKTMIRTKVQEPSPNSRPPEYQRVMAEVLKLLEEE